jgi:hypothetical protein
LVVSYRLYCLRDGRIVSSEVIEAADDVAAIEAARDRKYGTACELWHEARLVAFIDAPWRKPEE